MRFQKLTSAIFISSLTLITCLAQSEKQRQAIKEKMWGQNDSDFEKVVDPENFTDESAVVICRSLKTTFGNPGRIQTVVENYYYRERVLLLDKAAVEEYSKFETSASFNNWQHPFNRHKGLKNFVGIKVIKKDGSEQEVDPSGFLKEEVTQGRRSAEINKIAIPNLEVGDILDYYIVSENGLRTEGTTVFDEWNYVLADYYPVIKTKVEITTLNNTYLNIMALNAKSDFDRISSHGKKITYYYSLDSIPKAEEQSWTVPQLVLPTLKFQAFYAFTTIHDPIRASFMNQNSKFITALTEDDYDRILRQMTYHWQPGYYVNPKSFMTSLPQNQSIDALIRECYYYARQQLTHNYLNYRRPDEEIQFYSKPGFKWNFVAVAIMSDYLERKKVPHQLFITNSRENGGLDKLLLPSEAHLGIKIKAQEDLYITNFHQFALLEEIPDEIQGNEAYALDRVTYKNKSVPVTKISIPKAPTDSKVISNKTVRLSFSEPDSTLIRHSSTVTGNAKYFFQSNLITRAEYAPDSRAYKYKTNATKGAKTIENPYPNDLQVKDRDARYEKMLQLRMDNEDIKLIDFKLLKLGIWEEAPHLVFESSYQAPGLIQKAGPNYLFKIGTLLGGQREIKDEDLNERLYDYHIASTKQYSDTLTIEIPQGYEAVGIEKLRLEVDNAYGSFKTQVWVDGRTITIIADKAYKQYHVPLEKASEFAEFLNTASNFTKERILFQKQIPELE